MVFGKSFNFDELSLLQSNSNAVDRLVDRGVDRQNHRLGDCP